MTQYPDEPGAWWTEFPGSDRAAWATPSPSSLGDSAPARDGVRDSVSRRALKRRLVLTPGKRERARREELAEWRRQRIAAIREPSLKSGVITVGSGFGGTGKTDVAVTLAAIYAAARPADRVILADSNDDMPHGYIRLGGATVEQLPQRQRPLSIRGFHQACVEGRINVYADLRDAVAWLQGVAVIRGDTADESVGVDFGEQEYLTLLEFLQCMSNIVINDGGTGLFAKLQVGTLLHGDKYVFVTEASQLGFWSIGQVFSRYRNYEGEKERPLTEWEKKHLNALMDEATVVVDKFAASDPEQVHWLAKIRESFEGTQVSVVATPWDQALANRVPLNLGAVASSTLDAKLAMAEVVLRSADRANRRRQGLAEGEAENSANDHWDSAEPTRWLSEPLPPDAGPDSPDAEAGTSAAEPGTSAAEPDSSDVRILPAGTESDGTGTAPDTSGGRLDTIDTSDVGIILAGTESDGTGAAPVTSEWWPFTSGVRIIPARAESDSIDTEPGIPG